MIDEFKAREKVVKNIKRIREELNLSQKEFGERIGKDERFMKKLEANEYTRNVNLILISKVINVFNVPAKEIFKDVI